ncbi:MAG: hypothetical protein A3I05_03215 [Deltaproteobacteria bacterium RIFCSPLOWO2_02_FULL_44_10]|nr:MAG: hypothetical protein A3C46_02790 [Deltaproteobacteria bacterium RIFCSPHIGHO2_02_FULL_44_16]OGQ46185.1 MAG: hypothetical protein A3I05_03215 [Deltaproteobacteria bacterium RIFCSPLOWO2_02_FULL_44_10]
MRLLSLLMLVLFVSLGVGCQKKEEIQPELQTEMSSPTDTDQQAPEAAPDAPSGEQQPTQNQ